ncbi:hypothetical protein [Methylococcus capsulatus]|uniref:hypothetical protein n=1 Tax=Methylococcus capsulatus TaxID=414 RepID=UPI001C529EBA|nr:hypothetical protein [Methylococcus capsulatus]QXP89482.1 hypothetical protein KW114_10200 [Methylococcus capsulatus]
MYRSPAVHYGSVYETARSLVSLGLRDHAVSALTGIGKRAVRAIRRRAAPPGRAPGASRILRDPRALARLSAFAVAHRRRREALPGEHPAVAFHHAFSACASIGIDTDINLAYGTLELLRRGCLFLERCRACRAVHLRLPDYPRMHGHCPFCQAVPRQSAVVMDLFGQPGDAA